MIADILLWGLVVGVIHFVVLGAAYQNPFVARMYKDAEGEPGLRLWASQKKYIVSMFLGTQIEVFILTGAYLYLRQFMEEAAGLGTALLLAAIMAAVRVYPRFWNMWIQSTYPGRLLAVEFVNGTVSTFVIIVALALLPV